MNGMWCDEDGEEYEAARFDPFDLLVIAGIVGKNLAKTLYLGATLVTDVAYQHANYRRARLNNYASIGSVVEKITSG